ncbi:MAG: hypothetical protein GOVbin8609_15 [Prokaryotic dsDNA virus sp.]|nr:MAG: hypothetical protein GOVbin8609_15 [Prokaryotic dsDNA virus sp.]|tara:strand:- start:44252 stop:44509 length:258 start_codon:yes stop_codon:yes gene_type:complete
MNLMQQMRYPHVIFTINAYGCSELNVTFNLLGCDEWSDKILALATACDCETLRFKEAIVEMLYNGRAYYYDSKSRLIDLTLEERG